MIRALLAALLLVLPVQALAAEAAPEPIFGFEAVSGALPYRIHRPETVTPGQTYPLVLVLHGSGQMGTDNVAQVDGMVTAWARPRIFRDFPAFVVAPQVSQRSAVYAQDADGQPASKPGPSFAQVTALIDELTRTLPIDPKRIYLTGFSMGASTSLDLVMAAPERFAAVVAFSGVPPSRADAAKVKGVPMAMVHGDRDPQNPIEADRLWTAAVKAAGGEASLLEIPGLGHDVPTALVGAEDWRQWMFRKHR
jgi:predicted peptidase